MKGNFAILIVLSFAAFVSSTDIQFQPCGDKDIYNDLKCTINRVAIEGCGGSANRECRLRRGHNASMVVDFTPGFDADNSKVTMHAISLGEKAWPGMDTDGCKFMTCPIVNGVANSYTYGVNVSPTYPRSSFPVRVLLTSDDKPKCCFITRIKIQ